MIRSLRFVAALVCSSILSSASPQSQDADSSEAQKIMARVLKLADLYNWADAAPFFSKRKCCSSGRETSETPFTPVSGSFERKRTTKPFQGWVLSQRAGVS